MQVKDGIVQASKHLLCSPWAPGLFGDFAFNHDKRNKFLGFFKVLVYFQDVGTEKNFMLNVEEEEKVKQYAFSIVVRTWYLFLLCLQRENWIILLFKEQK